MDADVGHQLTSHGTTDFSLHHLNCLTAAMLRQSNNRHSGSRSTFVDASTPSIMVKKSVRKKVSASKQAATEKKPAEDEDAPPGAEEVDEEAEHDAVG